jgi:signal transduction histidine kinase
MFEACIWHRPDNVGTGLAIAAHALAAQQGTIAYRRAPGRGACFTITMPRAR